MMKWVSFLLLAACILPLPPEPATLPNVRPYIVKGSVSPPAGRVLTELRGELVVPVELVDPSASFEWKLYVDYDTSFSPNDPERVAGLVAQGAVPSEGEQTLREVRIPLAQIEPSVTLSSDGSKRCSVIEIIVAKAFRGISGPDGHTPAAPGGDTVTWFYNPNGTVGGCPVPGVPLTPVDAGGQ
jgi:hypothetical protein